MRAVVVLAFLLLAAPRASAQGGWTSELVGPRARRELRSPDPNVRFAAAERLGRRGEHHRAVAALLEALETEEDAGVRVRIFDALARRGDDAAIEPLARHLTEWQRDDRAAALRTMGAIGGERAIRILIDWLGAAEVGDAAEDALTRIGPSAVPHLVRALPIHISSARAATALGRIGDARAVLPLVQQLQRDGTDAVARVEMIVALGRIGDERASTEVHRHLRDADPTIVTVALEALARLSGPERARDVAAAADRGQAEVMAVALRALVQMDPSAALPRVSAVLRNIEAPAVVRRAALDALFEHPSPPLVPVLVERLAGEEDPLRAAEALSRVDGGAGVAALLERARRDEARRFDPALALALRRHASSLPSERLAAGLSHLRADGTSRGAVLSGLARDPAIRERAEAGLEAEDASDRASAALALQLLGDDARASAPAIAARLVDERDPMAFRGLALAALRLGARVDAARIDTRWWDASTAPEALWLTAHNLERAAPRTRRRARRAMRRSLRAGQPRVRAGAAMALALANDRAAWRALVQALDDEHPAVRHAVARALAALGAEEAVVPIAAHLRVEENALVRAALRDAVAAPSRRSAPAFRRGRDVLFARVLTAPGLTGGSAPAVDVKLPDGRWLRTVATSAGEVLVADLPGGEAEVQLIFGP